MSRLTLTSLALCALAVLGGAAYLGQHLGQQTGAPPEAPPATVAVSRGPVQLTVSAPGRLVSTRQRWLALPASGTLLDLTVRPGDTVSAGQVLATLDTTPLNARLARAQADLTLARARRTRLTAGPTALELSEARLELAQAEQAYAQLTAGSASPELAAARAARLTAANHLAHLQAGADPDAVQAAQDALEAARNNLWSAQTQRDAACWHPDEIQCDLSEAGVSNSALAVRQAQAALTRAQAGPSATDLQLADLDLQQANARLAQAGAPPSATALAVAELQKTRATARLAQLTSGPDDVARQEAESAVLAAEQALQAAQAELDGAVLHAPFDGTVTEVKALAGEAVNAGQTLILLVDTHALEVEATVVEEDLNLVARDQPAEFFFDAQPDAALTGTVARIVPQRASGERPLYPVYFTLTETPMGLLPGMSVDASIVIAEQRDVLRLPRALVRAGAGGTANVTLWVNGHAETRMVTLGLRGDLYVEIVSGLQAGDQVVGQ